MIHTADNNHQSTHINRQQPPSPPSITFTFTTTEETLIISAKNTLTTNEYMYEMPSHPNIDFNSIKEALQNNHYNTLINTAECLQLKVGLIKIEFVSKAVSEIKRLKERVERLESKQSELLFVINCQGVKIDEHENTIAEMKAALHTLRIEFDNKNEKEQETEREEEKMNTVMMLNRKDDNNVNIDGNNDNNEDKKINDDYGEEKSEVVEEEEVVVVVDGFNKEVEDDNFKEMNVFVKNKIDDNNNLRKEEEQQEEEEEQSEEEIMKKETKLEVEELKY